MMDPNKWVKTLPTAYEETDQKKYKLDPNRWVGTIPKIKTNSSITKYSFLLLKMKQEIYKKK